MATIKDVAREAGVSLMTVSRVINTPELVKEDTINKVNEVINRLGYRPNLLAKSLAQGRSKTIGIISSNRYNQAYTDIIASIEKTAYKNGFVVINTDVTDFESAKQALNMLLGSKVNGIIITPLEMEMTEKADYKQALVETDNFLKYFKKTCADEDVKVVTVSQKIEGTYNISFDYETQAKLSLDVLFKNGYKDISFLNCKYPEGLWLTKENTYKDLMNKNNLSNNIHIEHTSLTQEGARNTMNKMLDEKVPKAIYCANDLIASGAIQAILNRGYKIPEDIAVLGNDDILLCDLLYPKLTTISLGTKESGVLAMNSLMKMINGETLSDDIVEPYLVLRNSI